MRLACANHAQFRAGRGAGFSTEDLARGTLVLNYVNSPPTSLSLDFAVGMYSWWESDPSTPVLVGYFQVKG
jgi:hypothetical protein